MLFDHVLLDPAWKYANRLSGKGRTKFGSGASGKYRTETTKAMATFRVGDLAAPEACNMHMWVTGPFLPDAFTLFEAYEFTYSTIEFVWVKVNKRFDKAGLRTLAQWIYILGLAKFLTDLAFKGPGHYTASNIELVLLAHKGPILPEVLMYPQLIFAPRLGHSEKPSHVHEYIEKAYPGQRYIELFAREPRPGWVTLGNEIDGRDLRDSIPAILAEDKP